MTHTYRIHTTGHSSERYGNCEVCDKHCSEVFMQTETRAYRYPDTESMRYTYHNTAGTVFGHQDCLVARQKAAA